MLPAFIPRNLLASLATVALAVCSAGAQEGTPGSDVQKRVGVLVDSMYISVINRGDTLHVGMQWDSLVFFDNHAGGPAVRRVVWRDTRGYPPEHQIHFYHLPDLSPISTVVEGRFPWAVEFYGDSVTGWRTWKNAPRPIDHALPAGVYDASVLELMVRAGDLREGWRVAFPAYFVADDTVMELRGEVTGSVPVEVEGGRMADAWVVELDCGGGVTSTLWIEKEKRALLRQVVRLTPNLAEMISRLPPRGASPPESER